MKHSYELQGKKSRLQSFDFAASAFGPLPQTLRFTLFCCHCGYSSRNVQEPWLHLMFSLQQAREDGAEMGETL